MADLNIGNSSASVVVNAKHNGSVTPQIDNTYDLGTSILRWKNIYGNLKGNADTTTKLATTRTIQTNLASTTSASFDGSANITPGVTGTLPIANGGTGATTASTARDNLGAQSKVLYGDSEPSDTIGTNGDLYISTNGIDIINDLQSQINDNANNIAVQKARIDTFTTLASGSTTGDAELIDIRVKADGTTATSAGNAVREQISELKGDLGNLRFSITENNLLHVERKE